MAKIKKDGGNKEAPPISTASLPDIVFMLLFFFMVTTVMRQTDLKIKVVVPQATEIQKLEKKSLVSYIYVGEPTATYTNKYGTAPRVQLNDKISTYQDVVQYVEMERQDRPEGDRPLLTFSLKCDRDLKMGIITDVKQELRKANALKVNYSSSKRSEIYQ